MVDITEGYVYVATSVSGLTPSTTTPYNETTNTVTVSGTVVKVVVGGEFKRSFDKKVIATNIPNSEEQTTPESRMLDLNTVTISYTITGKLKSDSDATILQNVTRADTLNRDSNLHWMVYKRLQSAPSTYLTYVVKGKAIKMEITEKTEKIEDYHISIQFQEALKLE